MKKFELSAYGVEEMEQKELIEVNGGEPISISVVIAAATLLFTIIGTIAPSIRLPEILMESQVG